ncbi:MAG: NAD(+) diphosphatase [Kofleriaceae bacterium]
MVFVPAISTTATVGRLYVIDGADLWVVPGPAVSVPVGEAGAALHLGELDGAPCFARLRDDGGPPPGSEPVPLRQLYGALPDEEFAVAGRALGLTAWDRDHRFCGRCGGPTTRSVAERVRTCAACGHACYPRLSPAVIVLVERDGRCLLAQHVRARLPFYSTLAGFVEVGETLEACVHREVAEEVGVAVTDVRYFGSQPWPFSGSLMVGFTARWAGGDIVPEPTEIAHAGWFAPDALPPVPPPLSIARALIDDFVARQGG